MHFVLLALSLLFPSFLQALTQNLPNKTCPVLTEEYSEPDLFVDYQGSRIHFCCNGCIKKFKAHPEKYIPHLPPEMQAAINQKKSTGASLPPTSPTTPSNRDMIYAPLILLLASILFFRIRKKSRET